MIYFVSTIFIILIALSAMFKAISDLCADHYDVSVFSRFNPQFWDKNISWKNKWVGGDPINGHKKGLKYWDPISDAWHISNGCMICSFIGACFFTPTFLHPILLFIISGVFFTIVFNTFYNHIFKIK